MINDSISYHIGSLQAIVNVARRNKLTKTFRKSKNAEKGRKAMKNLKRK
jgi:hypothetical protein